MSAQISRRAFVKSGLASGAALAGPVIVPSSALGRDGAVAPSDRVTVGIVGAGEHGQRLMWGVLAHKAAQVVAVCDVYAPHLQRAKWKVNREYMSLGCAAYADSAAIEERTDIDAVVIATPDHWHAPNTLAAARTGKSIYLEKPMALSVADGQALRAAVQRAKGVFQFGTQQRSHHHFKRAVDLVRKGAIGAVREIEVWSRAGIPHCSATPAAPPPGLDYDKWLGPAPRTPHTEGKCLDVPARKLRRNWSLHPDYSNGPIAFLGIHAVDIALWGCPELFNGEFEVDGRSSAPPAGSCQTLGEWDVRMRFSGGIRLRFRGGGKDATGSARLGNHSGLEALYGALYGYGTVFIGSEGWLKVDRDGLRSFPPSIAAEPQSGNQPPIRAIDDHLGNWIDAIRAGRETISPVGPAFQADLMCHIADIAASLGRKLRFDPSFERFVSDADANRMLATRKQPSGA